MNANDLPQGFATVEAMHRAALSQSLYRIAAQEIVSTVEVEGHAIHLSGHTYWDMRPAMDPKQHPGECIDLLRERLGTGIDAGLLEPLTHDQTYIVRVLYDEAATLPALAASIAPQLIESQLV